METNRRVETVNWQAQRLVVNSRRGSHDRNMVFTGSQKSDAAMDRAFKAEIIDGKKIAEELLQQIR
jgi:hypothetical protein